MREMRRVFRFSNIGVLLYALLNGMILFSVWKMVVGAWAGTAEGMITFAAFYLLCACVSMTIVGETVARLLLGARRITRRDWAARLVPMEREIREGIVREYQYELDELQLFYVYDPMPSAFAIGRRTICVSTALLDCRDDVIRAALAQQAGRILNYDSMLSLYVTVGNVFVLGLLLLLRAVQAIVSLLGLLLTRGFFGRLFAVLAAALTWIPVVLVTILIQISYLVIHLSDQRKTYEADLVAVRLGYGQDLIRAIEEMDVVDMAERRNLWGILNRPHPGAHDRIAHIQDAMVRHEDARRVNGTQERSYAGDAHTETVMDWLGVNEEIRERRRMTPISNEPAPVQQTLQRGHRMRRL
ncbi:MAG: hypothetical protein IKU83_06315 [Lachnospiraceae bacterium]|nr:hypothetical protein [Lachnospiraceae bacterium]